MRAFHNDPAIKEKYLARVRAHAAADEIVKGKYWENGKGCAVGCTIHSDSHIAYEDELEIPVHLARLEDQIFEGLSNQLSKTWPIRFLEAIDPGADLSKVWPKIAIWILSDEEFGVLQYNNDPAILKVIKLYHRVLDGIELARIAAFTNAARAAAYAASAAYASAASADAYAYAYGCSALNVVAAAAYASHIFYITLSDKLVQTLREANNGIT